MVAIAWLHFVAYCMVDSRWEARGASNLDEGITRVRLQSDESYKKKVHIRERCVLAICQFIQRSQKYEE